MKRSVKKCEKDFVEKGFLYEVCENESVTRRTCEQNVTVVPKTKPVNTPIKRRMLHYADFVVLKGNGHHAVY
jgi:hypothetical protein